MEELDLYLVTNSSVVYTIFFALFFIILFTANILLVLIFIRNPVLITPNQLLYINLCCSNVTLALFALSFGVVTLISNNWIFPDMVCHMVGFFNSNAMHIAMFTMFSVLNERFHLRMNHRRHSALYTVRRVGVNVGVFWLLSTLMSALPFVPGLGQYTYHSNIGLCWTPKTLLGLLPTITNSIYLVLWIFITFNLLTLPRVSLPDSLKPKRSRRTSFLPQMLTSGIYTLAAAAFVLYSVLHRLGVLSGAMAVACERGSLLLTYLSLVLIPCSVIALTPELRVGMWEVFKKGSEISETSKYEQIDGHQVPSPQFSKNCIPEYPAHKKQIMMVPKNMVGYDRHIGPQQYQYIKSGEMVPGKPTCIDTKYLVGDPNFPAGNMRCIPRDSIYPPCKSMGSVQRSHSSAGYVQRRPPLLSPQRTQSLNRGINEQHAIEMSHIKRASIKLDTEPGSSGIMFSDKGILTPKTTTSSVTSSTTVPDIVEP